MKTSLLKSILSVVIINLIMTGCSFGQKEGNHVEEGEENGKKLLKVESFNEVRKGVKLDLKFDKAAEKFIGIMKNVSNRKIKKARVEVHLSNGVELGPTTPVNLKPGEESKVELSAKGQKFEWWSTHAETGSSEHGHGENGEEGHMHEKEGDEHN